jgi:AcrR family transcriptional regulator
MPKNLARPPLTAARVVEGAVELADREGLAALSMRRLAADLGVEAMSLYNHVPGKDALLEAMVEAVLAEIPLPFPGDNWVAQMRARAHSARAMLLRHRWSGQLVVSLVNIGPRMLAYTEATLACLSAAGFSTKGVDRAWNALDSHIYGFTLQELNFPLQPGDYAAAAAMFLPMIPPQTHPTIHAMSQEVIAGRYDGRHDFDFGLDLILDGLQAVLARGHDGLV